MSLCFIIKGQTNFNALENEKILRIGTFIITPNGKFSIYSVNQWDPLSGKKRTYLESLDLNTKTTSFITQPKFDEHDSFPQISKSITNVLFFLSNRSGTNQIWFIYFDGRKIYEPIQLSKFEIGIDNLKISESGYQLLFTTEVYLDCKDFKCTADKDLQFSKRGKNTWQTYDNLMVRHWDRYITEKVSHIYLQQIQYDINPQNNFQPSLKGQPQDSMDQLNTNSPVPPAIYLIGIDQFNISKDDNQIVYTGQQVDREVAWSTGWQVYKYDIQQKQTTKVSQQVKTTRTQYPQFSPNQLKISYLAMDRDNINTDKQHLELYDILSNTIIVINNKWEYSIENYSWLDDQFIFVVATVNGFKKLFKIDLDNPQLPPKLIIDGDSSVGIPAKIYGQKDMLIKSSSFTFPEELFFLQEDNTLKQASSINTNIKDFDFQSPILLEFNSAKQGEKINGFLIPPKNYDPKKQYPLAFLIHGGPESSFTSEWTFRWNPQIWSQAGYAVALLNPHGSTGINQNYTDAVRDDWGGLPYEDLMNAFNQLSKYSWIDRNRACALGANYGGYMVNWIQGKTDKFKCLVTHGGVFSNLSLIYETDELWYYFAEFCPLDNFGCRPYQDQWREHYLKFSPEKNVDNFKTPHLVTHGDLDYRFPITEGLSMFTALQVKGVPSRFISFYDENHFVLKAQNSIKWHDEVLGWMHKYTNGQSR